MIFFDAYAIIEVIKGNPKYAKFGGSVFITNTLHLSEVYYALMRDFNEQIANEMIRRLNFEFIEMTEDIALRAAKFKFDNRTKNMSYTDCLGYISAIKNNFIFLTGDKDFKDIENVEHIPKE